MLLRRMMLMLMQVGFSLKLGDAAIGLDGLSVNDRTLWMTKLGEAIKAFEVEEKKFLTRQKSGKWSLVIRYS